MIRLLLMLFLFGSLYSNINQDLLDSLRQIEKSGCQVVLINVSDEICDVHEDNFLKYELGAHFSRLESNGEFVPI